MKGDVLLNLIKLIVSLLLWTGQPSARIVYRALGAIQAFFFRSADIGQDKMKQLDKLRQQNKQEFVEMIMHSINHIDCGACPAENYCQKHHQHGYDNSNSSCRDIVGEWLDSEV